MDSAELLEQLKLLHPKIIDLSLGRIQRLAHAMGNPQNKMPPVIHVAGTNGKGSTLAFIEAILRAQGRHVHKFISPHLCSFHERINLAGPRGTKPISEEDLIDVLTRTEKQNAGEQITFFEITTAAAFLAFSEHPADFTLLETGLGGRLDATNIVDRPALSVITPVSLDHTAFLGETISQIAGEKAGIIKPGVPCIVGRQSHEARVVIEARAAELGAPVFMAGRDWDVHEQQGRLIYQDEDAFIDLPRPRLVGRHQIDNAGLAIASVRQLASLKIKEQALADGLSNAYWPARLERLHHGPLHHHVREGSEIWLDGGHNPDAGQKLAEAVADLEERVPAPLHLICGMMTTKDAQAFFSPFEGLAQFVATIAIPGEPKGYSASDLAIIARQAGLNAAPQAGLEEALQTSRSLSSVPVRVLICGSLYLAGHVLKSHGVNLRA